MTTHPPTPGPLCAAFAPLLPLISSSALEEDESTPTREHVVGCAWCQQELARYVAVDEALRRMFDAIADRNDPQSLFNQTSGNEEGAFILEDAMTSDEGGHPPTSATLSSQVDNRGRGPSSRTTTIASIAAALIVAVMTATIYTQFSARRTGHPAAAATPVGSFSSVITLPGPSVTVGGMTAARDGSVWFTETSPNGNKIGHVTAAGTLTEFPVPMSTKASNSVLNDITFGPDGNLWFTAREVDGSTTHGTIMRMTTEGAVTKFPLSSTDDPYNIVLAPDSALWFVELLGGGSRLARIMTDGHMTTYPLPNEFKGYITDLCVGPDGALWFAGHTSRLIGRMALNGQAQTFPTSYSGSAITSGPDGALWYTEVQPGDTQGAVEQRPGFIGRITTSGVASELPVGQNLYTGLIALGSDRSLWFTVASDIGQVGRIGPNGEVTIFFIGRTVSATRLASAPDAIWMLDESNTLWRYHLPA